MKRLTGGLLAGVTAGVLVWSMPVRAADSGEGPAIAGDEASEAEGVETEDIFGFVEGSDTGEAGEREISAALLFRTGKANFVDLEDGELPGDDRYGAFTGSLEVEYSLSDVLKVSAEATGVHFDQRNIFEAGSDRTGGLGGLSGELKYRLIERGPSPIGLALGAEVEWSRFDEVSGEQEDSVAVELKAFADAELAPNTLFAALNISYEPEWSVGGSDESEEADEEEAEETESDKESGLEIAAALAGQVAEEIFIGAEARYLVAGDGIVFDHVEGQAFYLGPTFYAQLGDSAYFKAAWSAQVSGHTAGSDDDLDLVNFERHQIMAQLGFEF